MSYMKHAYFGVQMFSKSVKIRFSKTLYSIGYSNGTNMSNSNENRSLFNDENEVPNDSFFDNCNINIGHLDGMLITLHGQNTVKNTHLVFQDGLIGLFL